MSTSDENEAQPRGGEGGTGTAPAPQAETSAPAPTAAESASAATPAEAPEEELHVITSPIVGTFYRASSPQADPFVKVGSQVEQDTVVCIIEAMKLMNEIQAETNGTIAKVAEVCGPPCCGAAVALAGALLRLRRMRMSAFSNSKSVRPCSENSSVSSRTSSRLSIGSARRWPCCCLCSGRPPPLRRRPRPWRDEAPRSPPPASACGAAAAPVPELPCSPPRVRPSGSFEGRARRGGSRELPLSESPTARLA